MIVNAYAILAAFLCLLQVLFGLLVIGSSLTSLRRWTLSPTLEQRQAVEERTYLQLLLALLLLGFNLASWPVLYLLLQSYVPSWPEVMCIFGVTRIGTGSLGSSRHLPWLLSTLQATKPLLVFLGGSWFVVYLANRGTPNAALMRRLLIWLLPLGLLSVGDALCEAAYLGIPKQEETLSVGCCTAGLMDSSRFVPQSLLESGGRDVLTTAFFLCVGLLCLALFFSIRRGRFQRGQLVGLLAGAAACLGLGVVFLVEVASPSLLQRPHYCPYDLVDEVPESMLALVLFLLGSFSVGWATVVHGCARVSETRELLPSLIGRVLFLGLFGYLGSMVMVSLELAL